MENIVVSDILRQKGFRFNKALGQNFIFDSNLLDAIVADSGVTGSDTVAEIGTSHPAGQRERRGRLPRRDEDVRRRVPRRHRGGEL